MTEAKEIISISDLILEFDASKLNMNSPANAWIKKGLTSVFILNVWYKEGKGSYLTLPKTIKFQNETKKKLAWDVSTDCNRTTFYEMTTKKESNNSYKEGKFVHFGIFQLIHESLTQDDLDNLVDPTKLTVEKLKTLVAERVYKTTDCGNLSGVQNSSGTICLDVTSHFNRNKDPGFSIDLTTHLANCQSLRGQVKQVKNFQEKVRLAILPHIATLDRYINHPVENFPAPQLVCKVLFDFLTEVRRLLEKMEKSSEDLNLPDAQEFETLFADGKSNLRIFIAMLRSCIPLIVSDRVGMFRSLTRWIFDKINVLRVKNHENELVWDADRLGEVNKKDCIHTRVHEAADTLEQFGNETIGKLNKWLDFGEEAKESDGLATAIEVGTEVLKPVPLKPVAEIVQQELIALNNKFTGKMPNWATTVGAESWNSIRGMLSDVGGGVIKGIIEVFPFGAALVRAVGALMGYLESVDEMHRYSEKVLSRVALLLKVLGNEAVRKFIRGDPPCMHKLIELHVAIDECGALIKEYKDKNKLSQFFSGSSALDELKERYNLVGQLFDELHSFASLNAMTKQLDLQLSSNQKLDDMKSAVDDVRGYVETQFGTMALSLASHKKVTYEKMAQLFGAVDNVQSDVAKVMNAVKGIECGNDKGDLYKKIKDATENVLNERLKEKFNLQPEEIRKIVNKALLNTKEDITRAKEDILQAFNNFLPAQQAIKQCVVDTRYNVQALLKAEEERKKEAKQLQDSVQKISNQMGQQSEKTDEVIALLKAMHENSQTETHRWISHMDNWQDIVFLKDEKTKAWKKLGTGNFSEVYEAKWKGRPVAVKMWKDTGSLSDAKDSFHREGDVTNQQKPGENVIQLFFGLNKPPQKLGHVPLHGFALVMELGEKTLDTLLFSDAETEGVSLKELSELQRLYLAVDIAHGCQYLHNQDLIHADIHRANVLIFSNRNTLEMMESYSSGTSLSSSISPNSKHLDPTSPLSPIASHQTEPQQYTAKLCDLGQAQRITHGYGQSDAQVGKQLYRAPELRTGNPKVTKKADVWSFGMLLYELFQCNSVTSSRLQAPNPPPLNNTQIPESVKEVISLCLKEEKGERPDFSDIVRLLEVARNEAFTPILDPAAIALSRIKFVYQEGFDEVDKNITRPLTDMHRKALQHQHAGIREKDVKSANCAIIMEGSVSHKGVTPLHIAALVGNTKLLRNFPHLVGELLSDPFSDEMNRLSCMAFAILGDNVASLNCIFEMNPCVVDEKITVLRQPLLHYALYNTQSEAAVKWLCTVGGKSPNDEWDRVLMGQHQIKKALKCVRPDSDWERLLHKIMEDRERHPVRFERLAAKVKEEQQKFKSAQADKLPPAVRAAKLTLSSRGIDVSNISLPKSQLSIANLLQQTNDAEEQHVIKEAVETLKKYATDGPAAFQ